MLKAKRFHCGPVENRLFFASRKLLKLVAVRGLTWKFKESAILLWKTPMSEKKKKNKTNPRTRMQMKMDGGQEGSRTQAGNKETNDRRKS